jgi:hypothetical protein
LNQQAFSDYFIIFQHMTKRLFYMYIYIYLFI